MKFAQNTSKSSATTSADRLWLCSKSFGEYSIIYIIIKNRLLRPIEEQYSDLS